MKYTKHRTNKILFSPGTVGFMQGIIHRTGDELAWREFMKRNHGGFVCFTGARGEQLIGEHCLGKDKSFLI